MQYVLFSHLATNWTRIFQVFTERPTEVLEVTVQPKDIGPSSREEWNEVT